MIGVSILISLIHLRLDLQTYDTDGLYILQRYTVRIREIIAGSIIIS